MKSSLETARRRRGQTARPAARFPFRKLFLLWLASLALSCGMASLQPLLAPDPDVPCPGGRLAWNLSIRDERADRRDSERVVALLRDSLSRSLAGCRWKTASESGAPTIEIQIHRFTVGFAASTWEAAAEWTVLVSDSSGRRLTEFESSEEVSRPNYSGSNNEREAMQQAFDRAMRRTLAGLRAVPPVG